jgi:SAM-dependent MidA family methyltransferase
MTPRLLDEITRGPITVARFMELALYDPDHGYYARAAQRSGTGGDFYTSVDAGPLFGGSLARLAEGAWRAVGEPATFDLVEAGAGNGRLARDVLDALAAESPGCYDAVRLTLVERSRTARAAQAQVLEAHRAKIAASASDLPASIDGLLYANELLDAMPVHRVERIAGGLCEWLVTGSGDTLAIVKAPPSTPDLARYFVEVGIDLPEGAVADVSLAALAWCDAAARALASGYLVLLDYGHDARRLYDGSHGTGTLRAYARHLVDPPAPRVAADATGGQGLAPAWLQEPGTRDLTAHVDFTAIERRLVRGGLARHACVDQARFLLALGLTERLGGPADGSLATMRLRMAARTLIAPDGLGGTHHALLAGTPSAPRLPFPFEAPWEARG